MRRAKKLPRILAEAGFLSLEITGKGEYTLTRVSGKIQLPERFDRRHISTNAIPQVIRDILRFDEQSIMSAVAYVHLLDDFFGFPCHHLQAHLRTTGVGGLQVEADDVFVGVTAKGRMSGFSLKFHGSPIPVPMLPYWQPWQPHRDGRQGCWPGSVDYSSRPLGETAVQPPANRNPPLLTGLPRTNVLVSYLPPARRIDGRPTQWRAWSRTRILGARSS